LAPATAQKNINLETLHLLPIACPPRSEQDQIVEEVDCRFSIVDENKSQTVANLKRAARLRQSILKCAFEGKLVPQDPNDEPADKLLERIHHERASVNGAVTPGAKTGRTPKRKGVVNAQGGGDGNNNP
jgi:type I restriction enzyme, S subunit